MKFSPNWQSSTRQSFSQIGNHPQDEVLAKLLRAFSKKFEAFNTSFCQFGKGTFSYKFVTSNLVNPWIFLETKNH
jgi:hypothetical protein